MNTHLMDNLILLIPMALAGLLLVDEIHCPSRMVHNSVRACGVLLGALAALVLIELLPILI
jgi:hypothetical protein